jgi:hypothetical protein
VRFGPEKTFSILAMSHFGNPHVRAMRSIALQSFEECIHAIETKYRSNMACAAQRPMHPWEPHFFSSPFPSSLYLQTIQLAAQSVHARNQWERSRKKRTIWVHERERERERQSERECTAAFTINLLSPIYCIFFRAATRYILSLRLKDGCHSLKCSGAHAAAR